MTQNFLNPKKRYKVTSRVKNESTGRYHEKSFVSSSKNIWLCFPLWPFLSTRFSTLKNLLVRCFRSNFPKRVAWSTSASSLFTPLPPHSFSQIPRNPIPASHLIVHSLHVAMRKKKNYPAAQIFDPFIFFVDLYSSSGCGSNFLLFLHNFFNPYPLYLFLPPFPQPHTGIKTIE